MGTLSSFLRRIAVTVWITVMFASPIAAHEGLHEQIGEVTVVSGVADDLVRDAIQAALA